MNGRRERWLGWLAAWTIRLLGATLRCRVVGERVRERPLFALPHGCLLLLAHHAKHQGMAVMISRHRDGEIISQAVERLGFLTVRGSSTRGGGTAAHELLAAHPDRPWAVTPDGPKGPRGSVKPGLIKLASSAGRSIQPVVAVARPAKRFRSWDRFQLPWPFARVLIHLAEPLAVPGEIDDATAAALARELERRIAAAEKMAEDELASW